MAPPTFFCIQNNGGVKYPLSLAAFVFLFYGSASISLGVLVNNGNNVVESQVQRIVAMFIAAGAIDVVLGLATLLRLYLKNINYAYVDLGITTITLLVETIAASFLLKARKEPHIQETVFDIFILFVRWSLQLALFSHYRRIIQAGGMPTGVPLGD